MILLDSYYVSEFLEKTLENLQVPVYAVNGFATNKKLNNISLGEFVDFYKSGRKLVLSNNESTIKILNEYMPMETITMTSNLFKDKGKFRESLAKSYPDFFYKQLSIDDLEKVDVTTIPFPIILKPSVGYSSVGVYFIESANEYVKEIKEISNKFNAFSSAYSKEVINTHSFIIEQYIEGEEYAIDTYFDKSGEPVILNVFKRMFLNEKDTSDRIYYTSKSIIKRVLNSLEQFLKRLGDIYRLEDLPIHIEVRIDKDGHVMPIEVNPLRFAGIGTTELGYYAYNINPYEYFFTQKKPDWDSIMESMDDEIYSFCCAEYDSEINGYDVEFIDHAGFQQYFDEILEYRIMPYENYTTFAVVFFKSPTMKQNELVLNLNLQQFVKYKKAMVSLKG